MPTAVTRQNEIKTAIHEVEKLLFPDVLRIRYEIGKDWSGEWAVFFRIVLSDDAAKRRLRQVGDKVDWELAQRLDFDEMGVLAYHNFRSETEQATMQEPAWA